MINKIKKLFGMVPSEEKWDEMKSTGLETLLGKEHDMVMHALIPFAIGGGLDLYYYPNDKGFSIATKELIDEYGNGPSNKIYKAYEFCMFSNVKFDLDEAKNEHSDMGKAHNILNRILNALSRYAFHAQLNPKETMEFPPDFEGGLGGMCLILDAYTKSNTGLMIGNKQFGLMLAIIVHRSEMEFAREKGTGELIKLLKSKDIYPYSDLSRASVV